MAFIPVLSLRAQSVPQRETPSTSALVFVAPVLNAVKQEEINLGRPTNRTSGGSRSLCSQQIVALVPGSGKVETGADDCTTTSESFLAVTSVASPTLWFYVASPTLQQGELLLLDGQQRLIERQTVSLSQTSGIIGIRLSHALDKNQPYRWVFSLLLDPQHPVENPKVEGRIFSLELPPPLIRQLAAATSKREQAALYARYGIWTEALTTLAQDYQNYPTNQQLAGDWQTLLGSVGLEAIAHTPLVNCCTASQ